MRRIPPTSSRAGVAICALAALVLAAPAAGADRFWNSGLDGVFGDGANWDDGTMGAPGADDAAVFDVAGVYTVSFPTGETTDRVLVRSGIVTFDLEEVTYTLLSPLPFAPGITAGAGTGDVAGLRIADGCLHGVFADAGFEAGAFGTLAVTGAAAVLQVDQHVRASASSR
jgi:hypothetical protein